MIINAFSKLSSDPISELLDVRIESCLKCGDILGAYQSLKFVLTLRCGLFNLCEEVIVEKLTHVRIDVGPILKTFICSIYSIIVVLKCIASARVFIVGCNPSELYINS